MKNSLLSFIIFSIISISTSHAQFLLELLREDSTIFKTNKAIPVKKIVVNGIHPQTKEVVLTITRENNAQFKPLLEHAQMLKNIGLVSSGKAEVKYEYYEGGAIKTIIVSENGVMTEKTEFNEAGQKTKIEHFNAKALYMTPRLTTIKYDKQNNEVYKEELYNQFVVTTTKEYLSDSRLKQESIKTVHRSKENNTEQTKWKSYFYESDFNLPKEIIITYKMVSDKPSPPSQDSSYAGKEVYQYDSKKRVVKKDIYERLGIYSETQYTYNDTDGSNIEDYKDIMFHQRYIRIFNSKGKLLEETEKEYFSDVTKYIAKKEYYSNGNLKSTITEYPATGKKTVNENQFGAPANLKFTNDEKGNWIEMYTDGQLTHKRIIVY